MSKSLDELVKQNADSLWLRLRNYTDNQLQDLLTDDTQLTKLCQSLPAITSLEECKDSLKKLCRTLAEFNMAQEPRYISEREQIRQKHLEASSLKAECEKLKHELDEIAESRRLDAVLDRLKIATMETELESEELCEKLIRGNVPLDTFIEQYQTKRRLFYERETKSKKLEELLRSQHF